MKGTENIWKFSEKDGWTETDIVKYIHDDEDPDARDARLGVGDVVFYIGDPGKTTFAFEAKDLGKKFFCEMQFGQQYGCFITETYADLLAFIRLDANVFPLNALTPEITHCEVCRYWRVTSDRKFGSCHRRAPVFMEEEYAHWPLTEITDSCGEGS